MIIVRPVKKSDLDDLYRLAARAKAGLTTLPHDRKFLRKSIEASVKSLQPNTAVKNAEKYLFVMEDTKRKKVVGTSAIVPRIGMTEPSYTYQIKAKRKRSKVLNINGDIKYLQLKVTYNGPTEIGTLFLDPKYRMHGNGKLLSFSRFLFMAQYRKYFKPVVIAELRGVINSKDQSPFWEAIGSHFFKVEFKKADLLGLKDKSFITDLVPRHPIYIPLLPWSAQKVLGEVHKNTRPALKILKSQGFALKDQIDIFEAGPVLEVKLKDIRTVKESRLGIVKDIVNSDFETAPFMIANADSYSKFRVAGGSLRKSGTRGVVLSRSLASALNLSIGSKVRYAPFKKRKKK